MRGQKDLKSMKQWVNWIENQCHEKIDTKCFNQDWGLEILPVPGTKHFLWTFLFFLLNPSFICHGSQFSSLFTILQEHMSL